MILKSSKNYIFDTLIPPARQKVKFDDTVAVAKIVHEWCYAKGLSGWLFVGKPKVKQRKRKSEIES